jgi:hypothetical protein
VRELAAFNFEKGRGAGGRASLVDSRRPTLRFFAGRTRASPSLGDAPTTTAASEGIAMLTLQDVPPMEAPDVAFSMTFLLVMIGIGVVVIAGMWKTFVKAGHPGWAVIVPFYNLYIMMKIAGRPGWWVLLCIIPIVSIVIAIIASIDIARNFGKGAGFGVGLALLGPIFYCILGFGDAEFQPSPSLG